MNCTMGISKIRVIKRDLFEADVETVDRQKEMKAFTLISLFYFYFRKRLLIASWIFTYT